MEHAIALSVHGITRSIDAKIIATSIIMVAYAAVTGDTTDSFHDL
jgi:hypothetical protein